MSVAHLRTPACLTALGVASALLLTACGSSGGGNGGGKAAGDTAGFPQGTGQISKVAPDDRKKAPEVSGKSLDGKKVSLSDFRGKVVVLNVWGSWCTPCRQEAPHFAKVSKEEKGKGVRFLGLNTRDSQVTAAQGFDKDYGIDYPSIYDPDGRQLLHFKGNLPLQTIPSTLVVDRQGRIAARALKKLTAADLHELIDPVAAEKA